MGLLDFSSKVLTTYKADIADHKAKIKELTGEQKELAKAELEAAKARNKQHDDWLDSLAKVGLAIGAVGAAYEIAKNSVQETVEFQRQQAASAGYDIEALQDAAGNLIDDMEAMRFAAQTSRGALKLNQEQMELFQRGIRAYVKDGFDAKEVTEAWTEALVSGKTRGLKQFGIEIDETGSKQLKLTQLMRVAQDEVDKYGGNLDVAGDGMRRLGVSVDDSLDEIKHSIGQMLIDMEPVITALASAFGFLARNIGGAGDALGVLAAPFTGGLSLAIPFLHHFTELTGYIREGLEQDIDSLLGYNHALREGQRATAEWAKEEEHKVNLENADINTMVTLHQVFGANMQQMLLAQKIGDIKALSAQMREQLYLSIAEQIKGFESDLENKIRLGRQADAKYAAFAKTEGIDYEDLRKKAWESLLKMSDSSLATPVAPKIYDRLGTGPIDFGSGDILGDRSDFLTSDIAMRDEDLGRQRGLASAASRYGAFQARQQRSWLESVFGKLDEFDAYKEALGGLAGALNAAYAAYANGEELSLGTAKKLAGAALGGIGAKMWARGLEETAEGVASLFVDPAAAGGHFAAAGLFAAGAVAIGGVARQLGGGAQVPSGGGAGGGARGAPPSSPSQAGGGSGRPITIIVGDEFAADTPARRQKRIGDAIAQARRADDTEGAIRL
jgi:hypothetical protein